MIPMKSCVKELSSAENALLTERIETNGQTDRRDAGNEQEEAERPLDRGRMLPQLLHG
jgi:hypothetical protein